MSPTFEEKLLQGPSFRGCEQETTGIGIIEIDLAVLRFGVLYELRLFKVSAMTRRTDHEK